MNDIPDAPSIDLPPPAEGGSYIVGPDGTRRRAGDPPEEVSVLQDEAAVANPVSRRKGARE